MVIPSIPAKAKCPKCGSEKVGTKWTLISAVALLPDRFYRFGCLAPNRNDQHRRCYCPKMGVHQAVSQEDKCYEIVG